MTIDVMPKPEIEPEYMGDGVYASFDGYQIWLWTYREHGVHKIALEPAVYANIRAFGAKVWELKP